MKTFKLRTFKVIALMLAVTSVMLSSAGVALAGAPTPEVTAACTHGTDFITQHQAKDAYTWVAKNIFGMKVHRNKLTAEFYGVTEYNPHAWWIVTSPDAQCSIDAVSGDVLMFSVSSEKYKGKKITLGEFDDPKYSTGIYENPNNAYAKAAAKIVNAKLAGGRVIDEVMIDGIQFVWDNNEDGFDPDAKGTIQVDAKVLMPSGRSYCLSFWGTNKLELKIFSSHPSKDACLWGYFYPEDGEDYPPIFGD